MNMESNDDRTGADGAQRDHQHELLCKLVFGEASDAERAEIEGALAASEHLREQRAELEATVQLVAGVRGSATSSGSETLSADRHAAILEAATPPSRILGGEAWFRRPAARVAAAVTLLVGMGVAVMELRQDPGSPTTRASRRAPRCRRTLDGRGARDEASSGSGSPRSDTAGTLQAAPRRLTGVEVAQGAVVLEAGVENRRGAGGGGGTLPDPVYVARGGSSPGLSVVDLSGMMGATKLSYRGHFDVAPPADALVGFHALGYGGSGPLNPPPPGGGGGGGGPASPDPSAPGSAGAIIEVPHAGAMIISKAHD